MKDATAPSPWPARELVAGFDRPGGGWLEARGRLTGPGDGAAVIVLGGVSAGRRLFGDEAGSGWWPGVAEAGAAIDPSRRQVLSFDFLGENAEPFPSVEDQSAAILALADAAGLERFSIIGASFGGVIALDIASRAADRVSRVDVLCAAARPNPMASAWRGIQRDIVTLAGEDPAGVVIARKLAMTTYRTPEEFDQRFTDLTQDRLKANSLAAYLTAAGEKYVQNTSPARFLALSQSMESADVAVEPITAPVRFLAFTSDRLVPPADIHRTAARIKSARVIEQDSLFGHDGFLKEVDAVNAFLRGQ